MQIGLLTAIWGRPRLTELVLRYYPGLMEFGDILYCIDSPECRTKSVDHTDWFFGEHANSPLSDKWQHGITRLNDGGADVDAVIVVGSDDLVTPGYIEACKYLIERGADVVQMDGAYFYDAVNKKMIWAYASRMGLGRCISRRLLDKMDWKLWPDGRDSGLDGAMWEMISRHNPKVARLKDCAKKGLVGLDIKTGENIWSFDHIKNNTISHEVSAEKVLREHFPSVADELLNW